MRERKGVDSNEREGSEQLKGVEEGKVYLYCIIFIYIKDIFEKKINF